MSFRWVFQHALFLPKHAQSCVQMIMKDGNIQARNKVMLALSDLFPNAKRLAAVHISEFDRLCPTQFLSSTIIF